MNDSNDESGNHQRNHAGQHGNIRTVLIAILTACLALSSGGCQQAELSETQAALADISDRVDALTSQLEESQAALDNLSRSDELDREVLGARLESLSTDIESLPDALQALCPQQAAQVSECETGEIQRVVVSADKMLVGELEYVWIDPPGVTLVARMDTGATSSSMHADNLMPFERDGEDWVRFDMLVGKSDSVTVERKVIRHARVIQQADPEGSRRPVVAMRVRLGDVQDTFEFTLADRSHLENEMILGRNFLTDVTLVDVGEQFIQPRYRPQSATDQ